MSIKSEIISQFRLVAEEQNKQLATITDELPLSRSGLDSLCLAVIVARLEDLLGIDPFSTDQDSEFPVTVGDFIQLYEKAATRSQSNTLGLHSSKPKPPAVATVTPSRLTAETKD